MPQQPLDRVHVDARRQQMGREGVTQRVNAAGLRDAGSAFGARSITRNWREVGILVGY